MYCHIRIYAISLVLINFPLPFKTNSMKLNIKAFALSVGIILALAVFIVTVIAVLFHWEANTLWKLHKIYIGYSPSWPGAFVGLVWGFVDGCIAGAIFAWLYNKLLGSPGEKAD